MRPKCITLLLIVGFLASMCSFGPVAAATTYNVSTAPELEHAFLNANDGDTIVLTAGTYTPTVMLDMGDRALNIIGAGSDKTILDGSAIFGNDFVLGRDDYSVTPVGDIVIRGITVKNASNNAIEVGNANSVTIDSCVTKDSSHHGIRIRDGSVHIASCLSEGNGTDGFNIYCDALTIIDSSAVDNDDDGFYSQSTACSILDSSAYRNGEDGFDVDDSSDTNDLVMERCISSFNEDDGFELDDFADAKVYNCVASFNEEDGFEIDDIGVALHVSNCTAHANYGGGSNDAGFDVYDSENVEIINCTATENGYGFDDNDDNAISLQFCNAYGNIGPLDGACTASVDYNILDAGSTMAGCISAAPLFADAAENDLRPLPGSPLINAGTDLSGDLDDDFRGYDRPQQGAYDIGAYEIKAAEPGLYSSVSVASFQPLMAAALTDAMSLWEDVLAQLPPELSGEQQALLDQAQSLIEGATSISNFIAANGALRQAMAALGELQGTL